MLEDSRPFAESKWKNENAHLVHKAMLEHGVRQLAHAILQQALAWRLLELLNFLSNIPLDERSVPLQRFLQGSGRDILWHTVYLVRHFPLSGRPDFGEALVGLLTHQERVWHEQKLVEVLLNIRAVEWKNLLKKFHIVPPMPPSTYTSTSTSSFLM